MMKMPVGISGSRDCGRASGQILTAKEAPSESCFSTAAPEYKAISGFAAIEDVLPEWEKLLSVSFCNRAFASAEWYLASCRMSGRTPYVITAKRGGEIEALLPLALNPDTGTAEFPHFGSDYNDLLARGGEGETIAHLLCFALMPQNGCRKLVLSRLRPDSLCRRALPWLRSQSGIECLDREINTYGYIELPATFEDYLASRNKVFRKNIKRILRDLKADGLTINQLLPDQFSAHDLTEIFITMALARQKEKSFLNDAGTRLFVQEVLPGLFSKGSLCAFAIWKSGRPVALDLCMRGARGLATWNGGFLESAERWSPGTALFAFGINRTIEMGLCEYDFIEGKETYKRSWINSSYSVSELELMRR